MRAPRDRSSECLGSCAASILSRSPDCQRTRSEACTVPATPAARSPIAAFTCSSHLRGVLRKCASSTAAGMPWRGSCALALLAALAVSCSTSAASAAVPLRAGIAVRLQGRHDCSTPGNMVSNRPWTSSWETMAPGTCRENVPRDHWARITHALLKRRHVHMMGAPSASVYVFTKTHHWKERCVQVCIDGVPVQRGHCGARWFCRCGSVAAATLRVLQKMPSIACAAGRSTPVSKTSKFWRRSSSCRFTATTCSRTPRS